MPTIINDVECVTYAEACAMSGAIRNYVHRQVVDGKIKEVCKRLRPGTQIPVTYLLKSDVDKFVARYNPRGDEFVPGHRYEIVTDGEQWEQLKPILEEMGIEWKDVTAQRRAYNAQQRMKQKADKAKAEMPESKLNL